MDDVAAKIEVRRAELKALQPNWDGYGAAPLSHDVIDAFVDDVLTFTGDKWAQIVPGGDGSIQAEWHLADRSVTFGREPDGRLYMSVDNVPAHKARALTITALEASRASAPSETT